MRTFSVVVLVLKKAYENYGFVIFSEKILMGPTRNMTKNVINFTNYPIKKGRIGEKIVPGPDTTRS
jgi:hypothetical protein